MILWIYFANSAGRASFCLVGNAALLTKVYFPRLILPLSTIFPGLLDFFVAFLVLILGMFIKGNTPSFLGICLVPMIVGWTAVVTFGVGLWLGALNVRYRDVNNFFNFIMQLWMFATPVLYPESLVDVKYRYWLGLNPLVGIISSFRSSLFGTWDTDPILIAESLVMTLLIVLTGMSYFAKVEKTFADII
jgi:lipopolysaccharide transport system permease protein